MLRLPIILTLVFATAGLAHAGDSTWLLCKGVADFDGKKMYVVASVLERRDADEDSRDLDVSFLKGANEATGTLLGKNGDFMGKSTALELKTKGKLAWKGSVTLGKDFKTFAMTGTQDMGWGTTKLDTKMTAKLTCEALDDLAIGH
jgi:hypothetical protein